MRELDTPPDSPAGHPRRSPGRPRASEAVDERAVLQAALRAFAVYGYEGVSVRTLNRELGVSHSWVNRRYGSKEALWRAAVDYGFGQQAALGVDFDPTLSGIAQLEHVVHRFLSYSADHPELLLIMNAEGSQDTDRLAYIYETYVDPPIERLDRLLRHLVEGGHIRPVSVQSLFMLMAHGGLAPFALEPLARRMGRSRPTSRKQAEQQIDIVTQILINGLRAPSPD